MKNPALHIIIFILLGILFTSCGPEKVNNNDFFVEGRIQNTDIKKMYAVYHGIDDSIYTDTVSISEGGQFQLFGKIDSVGVITFLPDDKHPVSVFVKPGDNISVNIDAKHPKLAQITGGDKLNKELGKFKKSVKPILLDKENIDNAITESRSDRKVNSAMEETLKPKLANLNHSLTLSIEQYIKKNPQSLVSAVILSDYTCLEEKTERTERIISMLNEPAKSFYLVDCMKLKACLDLE